MIGDLFRNGKVYTTKIIEVFDYDFPSLAEGIGVPHTLYDMACNEACVNIGTSPPDTLFFNRIYEAGRKVAAGFKESMRIVFDKHLGQWNYVAMPEAAIL